VAGRGDRGRREDLRRAARARTAADARKAKLALDAAEARLLTKLASGALTSDSARAFLTDVPEVGELMPVLNLSQLQLMEGTPNGDYRTAPTTPCLSERRARTERETRRHPPALTRANCGSSARPSLNSWPVPSKALSGLRAFGRVSTPISGDSTRLGARVPNHRRARARAPRKVGRPGRGAAAGGGSRPRWRGRRAGRDHRRDRAPGRLDVLRALLRLLQVLIAAQARRGKAEQRPCLRPASRSASRRRRALRGFGHDTTTHSMGSRC
jgi:hypothetical protein